MADLDLMAHGRLVYFARLLPHARDERELQAFVTECRVALLALEPHASPEPLPHHISRDLFPAQGADAEAVCDQILTAAGESLRERSEAGPDAPRLTMLWGEVEAGLERVLQAGERRRAAEEPPIEAGAGFAPGELAEERRNAPEHPLKFYGLSDEETRF